MFAKCMNFGAELVMLSSIYSFKAKTKLELIFTFFSRQQHFSKIKNPLMGIPKIILTRLFNNSNKKK